jgi:sulfite exporter TauE/SafE
LIDPAWNWPVLFGMGMAGTLHCAGMCGGLAVLAGGARKPGRFAAYLAGKSSGYVFIGALAGAAGEAVLRAAPLGLGARALALAAGLLLLAAGLESLGVLRVPGAGWIARAARPIAQLGGAGASGALVMGAANALLPCPMVYASAAMAAATGSPVRGAATMLVLAVTSALPLTLCSVMAGRFLRFRAVAAVLMIAMAAVTLHRGFAAAHEHTMSPPATTHHHVH